MFRSTTFKLTGVYVGVIMLISLFFSANLYTLATRELEGGFRRQADIIQRYSPGGPFVRDDDILTQRNQAIISAKRHILLELFYVNLIILVCGGVVSYLLARRTLRPIEEAHEAQKRFTADASHELRTPLTAMQTEIEVALRDPKLGKKEATELLRSNLEELAKLTHLSDGLLRLARQETNTLPKKAVSLPSILEEVIQANLAAAEQKKILIEVKKSSPQRVLADRPSLVELLNILVNNAVKYSPAKTTVTLDYAKTSKETTISVIDQGMGISPTDLPRIFDRFYRADVSRTKDQASGYGLGLAIAKNLAELHNGYITAKSTLGSGSTFTVHLPV